MLVGDVSALTALQHHGDYIGGRVIGRPLRLVVLNGDSDIGVDEVQTCVAGQRAGQQVGLAENLEAVADAEHRQPCRSGGDQLGHDGREPGDGAAAQVIAVREAAWQDHRVDAAQRAVTVPKRDRRADSVHDRPVCIVVIKRSGEGDDADPERQC